jgi:hypothetical protein
MTQHRSDKKIIVFRLRIHTETVKWIFKHELEFVKVNFQGIPYLLACLQTDQRADIAAQLLQFLEAFSPQKLGRVFTGTKAGFSLRTCDLAGWEH